MNNVLALCSKEKCAAIIDAVSHRVSMALACEANGVSFKTGQGWIEQAKSDMDMGIENEYTEFYSALRRAQMTKVREHLDIIASRPENCEADAWILDSVYGRH